MSNKVYQLEDGTLQSITENQLSKGWAEAFPNAVFLGDDEEREEKVVEAKESEVVVPEVKKEPTVPSAGAVDVTTAQGENTDSGSAADSLVTLTTEPVVTPKAKTKAEIDDIHESTKLMGRYQLEGESKEDFYTRMKPTVEKTVALEKGVKGLRPVEYTSVTINGITKKTGRNGHTHNYSKPNGEEVSKEDILTYEELLLLNGIHKQAQEVRANSLGDYSSVSDSELLEIAGNEQEQHDKVVEVSDRIEAEMESGTSLVNPDLSFSSLEYQNWRNNELVSGYTDHLVQTNANLNVDYNEERQALVDELLPEVQEQVDLDFAPIIEEVQNKVTDRHVSEYNEFKEAQTVETNARATKTRDALLVKYQAMADNAANQGEVDAINAQFQEELDTELELIDSEHADIMNTRADELNELITTDFNAELKDEIGDSYSDAINAGLQEHESVLALDTEWQVRFDNVTEQGLDNYIENFTPDSDHFSDAKFEEISKELDNLGFAYADGPQKKYMLHKYLSNLELVRDSSPEDIEDIKNEFWGHFYEQLNTKVVIDKETGRPTIDPNTGEPVLEMSAFALKDMATGALSAAEKVYNEEAKKYKPINYIDKRLRDSQEVNISVQDQVFKNNPGLKMTLDYSKQVLDNPEFAHPLGVINFFKGVGSLEGHKYLPFIGGVIDMGSSMELLELSKKENRTPQEDLALQMYMVQNQMSAKSRDLSTAHNAGAMAAESISFMGEMILTGGIYSSAQVGVKKVISKKIRDFAGKQIKKNVAKGVLGSAKAIHGSTAMKIAKGAEDFVSFVVASGAQTSANPQRYVTGALDNMTPEMAWAYSDDATELVNSIGLSVEVGSKDNPKLKDGDSFGKAFAKSFGTTWAEYGTERMGELIPGIGRGIIKKFPKAQDTFKRIALGRYLRKIGLNKGEALSHFTKNQVGWNGMLGEISEELINIPLSNLINGNDLDEGFNTQSMKEMFISIGASSLAFGGGTIAYNKFKNNKPPGYYVDNQRFETEKGAMARLEEMKADGTLKQDTDIEVTNDYIAFDNISSFLEGSGLSNEMIKTGGSDLSAGRVVATEVEILNELNANDRTEVEAISDNINKLNDEKAEIDKNGGGNPDRIAEIQEQLKDLKAKKHDITKDVSEKISLKKKTIAYKEGLENLKKAIGSSKFNEVVTEATTEAEVLKMLTEAIVKAEGLTVKGDKYFNSKGEQVDISKNIEDGKTSHGAFLINADGSRTIIINKEAAIEGMGANVAGHEFLHYMLAETLNGHPELKIAFGEALMSHISDLDPRQIRDTKFRNRVAAYQKQGYAVTMEETLNILSDAMANGTYNYNETALVKLGDIIRRVLSSFGVTVKFESGKDVFNFIRDYNAEFASGKGLSKGMQKTLEKGARVGGGIKKQSESYKAKAEEIKNFLPDMSMEQMADVGILWSKETDASAKVQEIYEAEGLAGAMDIIEAFKPIVWKQARRFREVPGYNEEDIVSEIEIGKRGIYDLINEYKPESGVPLAAWINKYLPVRANEAAGRILGEQFMDDITEAKGVTATETAEDTIDNQGETRKKKKIVLSDRFKVSDRASTIAKEYVAKAKLDGTNYKATPVIMTEIVGELMGISPAKILNNANLTKPELASAQAFISKNPELLIAMLPEGSDSMGKATGVQKVLQEGLYNKKSVRAKTGAGLNVQVKKPNIKRTEFIERFGIVDGVRHRNDRNTSSRVLALAKQLDKVMSNQALREALIESGAGQGIIQALSDGKSSLMFSREGTDTGFDPKMSIGVKASNRDLLKRGLPFLMEAIPDQVNPTDKKAVKSVLTSMFKDTVISTAEINAMANNIHKAAEKYNNINNTVGHLNTKVSSLDFQKQFLADAISDEVSDKSLTQLFSEKLPKGFTNITNSYTIDRVKLHRETLISFVRNLKENGWSDKEVLRMVYTQLRGMYSSASKVGDGRYILDSNGDITLDPKWEDSKPNAYDGSKWKRYTERDMTNGKVPSGEKVGDLKLTNAGSPIPQDHRGQMFANAQDLIDTISKVEGFEHLKGKGWNAIAKEVGFDKTTFAETSKAALTDLDYDGRLKQAKEARVVVEMMAKFYVERLRENVMDHADLLILGKMLGSNMSSPMKRAANLAYVAEGLGKLDPAKLGSLTEYEHMIPTNQMILELMSTIYVKGKLPDGFWDHYEVAVIPKAMDKVLIKNGLRDFLPSSKEFNSDITSPDYEPWRRYYNKLNLGSADMGALKSIKPSDKGKIIGEDFVKASNLLANGITTAKAKQIIGATSILYSKEAKGASVWDFDDTLARTKSGVRYKLPNPDGSPQPGRKVIFLAGGAGSGKSSVVKTLGLEAQGYKTVNQDISLEWLKKNAGLPTDMSDLTPEQLSEVNKLAGEARRIAKRKQGKFKGRGDGVVVDGTGGSLNVIKKKAQEFKDAGYDVQMVFVDTSVETAIERNANRKERSLSSIIVKQNHKAVQGNKEGFKDLFGENFAEVNTDNLTEGGNLPTDFVNKITKFTSSYKNARLEAGGFAEHGGDLMEQGATFDFSEFNVVKEGKQGPLFSEALARAKKYGTKDQFVLTARPMASAPHIQLFLKEQGLDIPLENITGLASSLASSKADWIAEKILEGYNDIYFADDHMANVKAVSDMLAQHDVKSKVVQAKILFSKEGSAKFNEILERVAGIPEHKEFSGAAARLRGSGKGRNKFFVPPSAEDFKGLIYSFLGKGKDGDADMAWFKENLLDPFSKGIKALNATKQQMTNEYAALKKAFPDVVTDLSKKVGGTDFTLDAAIRVHLWTNAGFEVPGLSKSDTKLLLDVIKGNPAASAFADVLSGISRRKDGYIKPGEYWVVESIASDLHKVVTKVNRSEFLSEWLANKEIIFSDANMNKIEAVYGTSFREALENVLFRMQTGSNRVTGSDKLVSSFTDWINGSVGAVMFFNTRSAVLQTMSVVNFIDWKDNNLFQAAKAFGNQKQYWGDFMTLFNSDMLKQRRAGMEIDVSVSELTDAVSGSTDKAKAALRYLLQVGFTPTQIADSFAIAAGGSTFYRNKVNKYLKEGMSQKGAESQAFQDFQEIAEETQQSSRPDMISQQQSGVLGRLILAWQNTPMQYTRLTKKAISDLANGRGDWRSHVSRIVYYGLAQNLMFGALQSGLAFIMFGDDDEAIKKKELRVANGALDTLLRGTGIYGALVSTLKNTIMQYIAQRDKPYGQQDWGKLSLEMISLSPPIGSKIRKIVSSAKTYDYNEGVIEKMGLRVDNPLVSAISAVIEGTTNLPVNRIVKKLNNLDEAITGNHETWKRVMLMLGWDKWSLGVKDADIEEAKAEVKEDRAETSKAKREAKKVERKKAKAEAAEKEAADKKASGIKDVRCSGIKSNGSRCSLTVSTKAKTAKCSYHKTYKPNESSDNNNNGIKEYRCVARTGAGKRCSNRTENKNNKCYAHQ